MSSVFFEIPKALETRVEHGRELVLENTVLTRV
jgi:hypothetical protein